LPGLQIVKQAGDVPLEFSLLQAQGNQTVPQFGRVRLHSSGLNQCQQSADGGIHTTLGIASLAQLLALTGAPLVRLRHVTLQEVSQPLRREHLLRQVLQHHAIESVHTDAPAGTGGLALLHGL
jgi:hypothetical protein